MMFKVLITCLLFATVFAQNCNVDPCSMPPPDDCEYEYCAVTPGSCTPTYYDDDDEVICQDEVIVCPAYACRRYCPHGYVTDPAGCPTCECAEKVDCSEIACTMVACGENQRTIVLPGECCPTCVPDCESIECPEIECEDEEEEVYGPYDCCPSCLPSDYCDDVECPDVDCNDNEQELDIGCCTICVPAVDCKMVDCPSVECADGMMPTMYDDWCCPVCDYLWCEDDDELDCREISCAQNETAVILADSCCPTCVPDNYCSTVMCPMFAGDCPEDDDYHVQKSGSCCSYCAGMVCKDSETTRCDSDDRPVCTPGYYRGENCTEVVPESDRVEIRIEITVNGIQLTADDIKFFIANKLDIDAMYITVEKTGDSTFVITISWEKNSPPEDLDESAVQEQLDNIISANPNFTKAVNPSSGAMKVTASVVLIAVALVF